MAGQDQYAGFREFVLSRGQELSRAAYLLTGDHQGAEDLLQEALAKTARSTAHSPIEATRPASRSETVTPWPHSMRAVA